MITLSLEGLILGYYTANFINFCKENTKEIKHLSPLCPICELAQFQVICRNCKKIISCGQCFNKIGECPRCYQNLRDSKDIVKVFMA